MSDIENIKRILNGDKEQYSLLMKKYYKEIFKYIYNITGNYETTEDLVQEVFFKVYNNLKKYNNQKSSFRTWLYRISNNHTINYLKSKAYKESQSTEQFEDFKQQSSIDIEKEITKEDQISQVKQAIIKLLNPKQQKIMFLHYFAHLEVKEISNVINVPEKTIYSSIKSSIEKIKKEVI